MNKLWVCSCWVVLLTACGGGGGSGGNSVSDSEVEAAQVIEIEPDPAEEEQVEELLTELDVSLRLLIEELGITADPLSGRQLPDISDAKVQLGKRLFFAKNLGGQQDVACVSCHHPVLGGGDNLSLPVGVDAVNANDITADELLGLGRFHGNALNLPSVPRNAPTVFNIGLLDRGLFWDSRVASLGAEANANGTASGIVTPDSAASNIADSLLPEGTSLPAAQARFPVLSTEEMRGNFATDADNQTLRANLALRFADASTAWPMWFEQAYGDEVISFDRIAEALGEFQRSMVFISNDWQRYVQGNNAALSEAQKRGALLFYQDLEQQGAGCARCHSGDRFTDERHHLLAFPQIGPGKGDVGEAGATDDFGREQVTGRAAHRYHFRTSSLLNVAVTAPYGHAGAYQTLAEVVRHYVDPGQQIATFFGVLSGQPYSAIERPICELPQLVLVMAKTGADCSELYPGAYSNTMAALARLSDPDAAAPLRGLAELSDQDVEDLVAFMQSLTDPCVESRSCLNDWIIDGDDVVAFPDVLPLIATDAQGVSL